MDSTSLKKDTDAAIEDLTIVRSPDGDVGARPWAWRQVGVWGGLGVVLLATAAYWFGSTSADAPPVDVPQMDQVRSAPGGQPPEAPPAMRASGYVMAQRQAAVASKGTGRLEYLGVAVGDRVKAKQIIARLERADMAAAFAQAQAQLGVAHAALANTEAELHEARLHHERLQTLLAQGFVAQAEYESAEARFRRAQAAVRSAEAGIQAAQADVRTAEVQVENTNIRAPFDGIVLKKFAEVGEVVAPFAASASSRGAVVLIADMTSLQVEAEVSESAISQIRVGQPAEINLDGVPGRTYRGEVLQITPTADRTKATVLAKLRFLDLDDRVLPEMSATVRFLRPWPEPK